MTPKFALWWIGAAAALGAGLLGLDAAGADLVTWVRDPASTVDASPTLGILSILSTASWTGVAAIFGTVGLLLRGVEPHRGLYFLVLALGTLAFMVDDAAQFHETVFPEDLDIHEGFVYAAYLAAGVAFVAAFYEELLRFSPLVLLLGVGCLAASVGMDGLHLGGYALEEYVKYLGIGTLGAYGALEAARVRRLLAPRPSDVSQ